MPSFLHLVMFSMDTIWIGALWDKSRVGKFNPGGAKQTFCLKWVKPGLKPIILLIISIKGAGKTKQHLKYCI